jgi:hypothetical protein
MKTRCLLSAVLLASCATSPRNSAPNAPAWLRGNPELIHFNRYQDCFRHLRYAILDSVTRVQPLYMDDALRFHMVSFNACVIGVSARRDTGVYVVVGSEKLVRAGELVLYPCTPQDTAQQTGLCFAVRREAWLNKHYCAGKPIRYCRVARE